jgi:hypothetical protein
MCGKTETRVDIPRKPITSERLEIRNEMCLENSKLIRNFTYLSSCTIYLHINEFHQLLYNFISFI